MVLYKRLLTPQKYNKYCNMLGKSVALLSQSIQNMYNYLFVPGLVFHSV